MSLKYFLLLPLMLAMAVTANAQYNQVTATNGNTQFFPGGYNIKANRFGFGPCQGKYINSPGFCDVYPYYIGDCGRNGWTYELNVPVTDIRIHMASLNDNDTIRISISGSSSAPTVYTLTAGNISSWKSACSSVYKAIITNGLLTASGAPSGFSDVQIDIQNRNFPYTIKRITVEHMRSFSNTTADGVVYDLAFADDSCHLQLNTTVDDPVCQNRPMKLHASDFPNTTHYWRRANNPWTASGANPVIPSASVTMTDLYIDSAVRGACTYIDTVSVYVDLTPVINAVSSKGPKCPGEDDSLSVSSVQATYVWYGPDNFFSVSPTPVISSIQPKNAGIYYVYARSLVNNCISDTAQLLVSVNQPAHASFTFKEKLGCREDTVEFINMSNNAHTAAWDFGDGSSSSIFDPVHIYKSPAMPAYYTVKLTAGNGTCKDDTTMNIVFDHPLKSEFIPDKDSVCQHTLINFKNNSVVAGGTIPDYLWSFKDGTNSKLLEPAHLFDISGVYDVRLIVTDFLGCKDTANHIIVVDSVGSIGYSESDRTLCLGQSIRFNGYYSPWGINSAIWDMGDGSILVNTPKVDHAYDKPGTYHVTFSADYRICPNIVFSQDITIKPLPVIDLGPDRTFCPNGAPVLIKDKVNTGNPLATWKWNTEVMTTAPEIMVYAPGTYSATVEIDGCATTDDVIVTKSCYINIPNAFTPNGDGIDDNFLPRELLSRGLTKFDMHVFNRWGQQVFTTNDMTGKGWDGKFNNDMQPLGVYIYLIEAAFVNGDSEKYQGNVTLLR